MKRTKIIAEIGNTHEGSVGLAKQFILEAANCGVDAVKFQTHIFEEESLPSAPNPPYFKDESRKAYFERTAFTIDQYQQLKSFAEVDCGVEFLSSPFSIKAAQMLIDLGLNTLKIPSGEISNIPLLEFIAENTNASIILSSGMSSWLELDRAVEVFKGKNETIVLQCTSQYPCPPENAGLNLMQEMGKRYNCKYGFSDHTLGIGVPLAAVMLGASVVEKHFTLSKKMYGSDAKNSVEPHEFLELVKAIRDAEISSQVIIEKDDILKGLGNMKLVFEKSIVTTRNLTKGEKIEMGDLAFKKPGNGIPAANYKELIGKVLKQDVNENEQILFDYF